MGNFMFGVLVGFLVGTVVSCILLAKKNLQAKDALEASIENKVVSAKDAFAEAKKSFKEQMQAYDEANK